MGRNGKYDATLNCRVNTIRRCHSSAQTLTKSSFPRRRESSTALKAATGFQNSRRAAFQLTNDKGAERLCWIPAFAGMTIIVLFLNNLTLPTFRHPILQARRSKNNYEKHYRLNAGENSQAPDRLLICGKRYILV